MNKFALFSLLAVAAAFLHPAIALFVALFFSLFFTGFVALKLLKADFSFLELACFSVLLSVLLSTHLVYWLSIVLGYSAHTVLLAFAFVGAIALLVKDFGFPKPCDGRALLAALLLFAFLFAMFSGNLWVPSDKGVVVGGWNWSDLFLHLSIMQSVNNGNFPPQAPFFAGFPLLYHWFADFHTAFVSLVSGMFPVPVIRLENALYNALAFLLFYLLALRFTENKKTALLAAFLILFGGSFAFVNFFHDAVQQGANPVSLALTNAYDNDWKYFQVPSLLGGFMLVQRPQMVGVAALVAVLLLLTYFPDPRKTFLAGLILGLLAPFQYYAFAAAGLVAVLWFVLRFEDVKRNWKSVALFFVPCVLSLPFVLPALFTRSGGVFKVGLGWLAPQGLLEAAAFYVANFGVPFVLALLALLLCKTKWKKFLFVWLAVMFVVPNLFSFSGTQWDMAKFFAFMMVPAGVLAAVFIADLPAKLNGLRLSALSKPLQFLLVFFSVLTPLLFLVWTASSTWVGLTNAEMAAGKWVEENTPQESVFAAYPSHNSPVDAVAGRFRLTTYSSWMNNFGLPYQEREAALQGIYCGSANEAVSLLNKYGARYVYLGPNERREYDCGYAFTSSLPKVYDAGGIRIYRLVD